MECIHLFGIVSEGSETTIKFLCILFCRNDYVIIRVTFSGEEFAHVLGGKSLRSVPSRQTDKDSKTVVHVSVPRSSGNRLTFKEYH